MGSFTSTNVYNNTDHQDNDVDLPQSMNGYDLLAFFENNNPKISPIQRMFFQINNDESDLRIMQWNVLSQTIGLHYDKFIHTPKKALDWDYRRFNILQELVTYTPDIFCLQEVDHFQFLNRTLATQGYAGVFFPKPDSPCLYVKDNNGPDGCAVFYLKERFEIIQIKKKILQVWTINSNQVAIIIQFRDNWTQKKLWVATTHLKARSGALMSSIRKEQGKALLEYIAANCATSPVVICGDFNAEPTEPVYEVVSNHNLNLSSAYAFNGKEPVYTTWKIREDGEQRQTLDYIFYSKNKLQINAILKFPDGGEIGEARLPSMAYPSDHLSLVCDMSYI